MVAADLLVSGERANTSCRKPEDVGYHCEPWYFDGNNLRLPLVQVKVPFVISAHGHASLQPLKSPSVAQPIEK